MSDAPYVYQMPLMDQYLDADETVMGAIMVAAGAAILTVFDRQWKRRAIWLYAFGYSCVRAVHAGQEAKRLLEQVQKERVVRTVAA